MVGNDCIKEFILTNLNILYTVKAETTENIQKTIKSVSEQINNKDTLFKKIKILFGTKNYLYKENNITTDSLLLAIVLFDISGQYDNYFREINIFKIREICDRWNLQYDYIRDISFFHKELIIIFQELSK